MNTTKSIVLAIRQDLSMNFDHRRNQLNGWLSEKMDRLAVAVVKWILDKPSVQKAIADKFNRSTPMCDVLSEAIEYRLAQVSPEDISGLSDFVDREIEERCSDFDFSGERWFSDAIREVVHEEIDQDEIEEKVIQELIDRLRR